MKTFLIKVSSVLFAVVLLSSCLGDSDSYYEVSEDFAYIKKDDKGEKYAQTARVGAIKADKIQELTVGEAYYVSYKVTYSSAAEFLEAETFNLVRNKSIPKALFESVEPYSNVDEHLKKDSIHPTTIEIGTRDSYKDTYDDYWEIKYNILKKEDDKIDVYFYYDPNGQEEVKGVPLKENQVIVDIRFVKSEKSGNTEEDKNERLYAMSSLSDIRKKYSPDYSTGVELKDGTRAVNVLVKFRYIRDADKEPAVSYIGSFNTTGSELLYYMTFLEKEK